MSFPRFSRFRALVVISLILGLVLAGSGVATAQWIVKATATAPVTAGTLHTQLDGTAALGATDLSDGEFTEPVALTAHNPNPVPVNFVLDFGTISGNLNPADVEVAVWGSAAPVCATTVPTAGVTTGTLADALDLDAMEVPAESDAVLCAATRFTGVADNRSEYSLTSAPTLIASLPGSDWTAIATGAEFTQVLPAPLFLAPEPVDNLRCTDVGDNPHNSGVELSWLPVPGATSYEVRTEDDYLLESTLLSTVFLDETGHDLGSNTITRLSVVARNADGASAPVYQKVRLKQGSGMGNHLRCVR